MFSCENLRSKQKFHPISTRICLTKDNLIELLNNNVNIRKLLPYSTKNLKTIAVEKIKDKDIVKKLQTINNKHVLSDFLFNWVLNNSVQFIVNSEELEIRNTIKNVLNDLLIEMAHIDDRFSDSQLIPSGSGFEGFKMDKPDEFDFLYEFGKNDFIVEKTIHFIETSVPCFIKVVVDDIHIQLKWKEFIDNNEKLLNASKLRLYIVLLMQQSSFTNKFRYKWWKHQYLKFNLVPYHENCQHCLTFVNQSKVGAILHVQWNGKKYKNLHISIDIAPAIPVLNQWPSNANQHSLPVIEINDLTQWGYHVVTKADYNLSDTFSWRISFSLCEYQIFSRLNLCQSACFAILKLLRIPFEDTLTTWIWKSMFFQQLQITNKSDWDSEQLSERVSNCLSCIWPDELAIEPLSVQSFFIHTQSIDPTDATRGYNTKNIFLSLCHLKLIQKQFLRIIKNV
ncbi:unnamed protein product [Didymodactylos carnosus]|uniref:Mab-21-like nucleotidyltransferase domain-containing protein n=1 Tax=Didymodactylos carnosus TaxID=1234261 RepID=A0A813YK32_9BILA|nr:unnamed protein product [Didymodactylos carnosus]CAF3670664.1 unnamed protein product [Didymodactylos carnosus]